MEPRAKLIETGTYTPPKYSLGESLPPKDYAAPRTIDAVIDDGVNFREGETGAMCKALREARAVLECIDPVVARELSDALLAKWRGDGEA